MRSLISRLALVSLVVPCLIGVAAPLVQAADAFSGKWTCTAKGTSNGDVEFVLELSRSGETVTGTLTVGGDNISLEDVKADGNKLEFAVSSPEGRYTASAVLESDKLKGTWKDWNENSGSWEGQKQN